MSTVGLADLTGLSRQVISLYEKERSSPSPASLDLLAEKLNVPPTYFTRPERTFERGTIFYRSMASTTKAARLRAEGRFAWLREIVGYLSEYVDLPASNFPALDLPDNPLLLSDEDVEVAAEEVRRYWGMRDAPIGNVVTLLENQGAIVAMDELGADTLDGLSEFAPDEARAYVAIATDKGSAVRWRFDAAHELGHLILHSKVSPDTLVKAAEFKRIEEQAHRFAGAFLLPASPFGEDFFAASLDALRSIKPKWRVSVGVMIKRAVQLDFISAETERKLWINYGRRGWRKDEPYDDTLEPEEPRLLRSAFDLLMQHRASTPDDVLAALDLPMRDVEKLAGLGAGYLSNDFSPVSLLRAATADQPAAERSRSAEVISLPHRARTR